MMKKTIIISIALLLSGCNTHHSYRTIHHHSPPSSYSYYNVDGFLVTKSLSTKSHMNDWQGYVPVIYSK